MQVVDPHMHLWNLQSHRYPWLAAPRRWFIGPYESIAHTHELADFLRDAEGIEVLKLVHIDAGHDPSDPVAETRWLQEITARPESRGMPQAIVATADLSAADAEAVLEAHAQFPNLRGIRQILNVHPDPFYDFIGRDLMAAPAWQRGFGLLRRFGLSFDLQLYPRQMPQAAALARAHPDTPIILNHAGMFVDRDSVRGWLDWRDGMRALAACANVSVKISGLGMLDHRWTVESIRPYVLETIAQFDVARCMFASNFPVDRLYGSYAALWNGFAAVVAGASADEHAALFRGNAERIYRI